MIDPAVRRATADDAAAIARVQVQGWHEAYTGRMPQAILDGMDAERSAAGWGRAVAALQGAAGGGIWVAERDGEIVGFASSGPGRDDDAVPGRIELFAIYVLAAHYGTGAGAALLDAAVGDAPASLWVLADNPRAQAFYAKHRFAPDGAVKDDDRWGEPVRELRMVRS